MSIRLSGWARSLKKTGWRSSHRWENAVANHPQAIYRKGNRRRQIVSIFYLCLLTFTYVLLTFYLPKFLLTFNLQLLTVT